MSLHPDSVTENRSAGERTRRVNRNDSNSFALFSENFDDLIDQSAFARTGKTRDTDDIGTACFGIEFLQFAPRIGQIVVNIPHESGCRSHITFEYFLSKSH